MQRVVGGRLKGRRLLPLPGKLQGVRPSSSRVRGAIYDRLQREVRDARLLDLCAGTGALGIEGLSRGAREAVLVERHPGVARFLEKQLEVLNLGGQATVRVSDAGKYLEREAVIPFDLILFDPPYDDRELYARVLECVVGRGWLAEGGTLIVEYQPLSFPGGAPVWPGQLALDAERAHGGTVLAFLSAAP